MNHTTEHLLERIEAGEHLKFLFFWGHRKSTTITKSCFSQWYESKFVVNGIEYQTAEHYMMAAKAQLFGDKDIYQQIIESDNAAKAKALGRKVKGFSQRVWEEHRFQIVVRANFHKFSQNQQLANFLINTKQRILVEASPVDNIWGIGLAQDSKNAQHPSRWNGLNLLGYALMETRDILNKMAKFKKLHKPVLPPWLAYPEIQRYSIGWRMGYGEDHIFKLVDYLDGLTASERITYEMTYPEPPDWNGWYEKG